jgi:hypothetical protein
MDAFRKFCGGAGLAIAVAVALAEATPVSHSESGSVGRCQGKDESSARSCLAINVRDTRIPKDQLFAGQKNGASRISYSDTRVSDGPLNGSLLTSVSYDEYGARLHPLLFTAPDAVASAVAFRAGQGAEILLDGMRLGVFSPWQRSWWEPGQNRTPGNEWLGTALLDWDEVLGQLAIDRYPIGRWRDDDIVLVGFTDPGAAVPASTVAEPTTAALFETALLAVVFARRRVPAAVRPRRH